MIPVEKEKLLTNTQEDFTAFMGSKEGASFCSILIDNYSAKERKNILKQFKGKVLELLNGENSHAHLVIMKILTSIDDTVQINKNILSVIIKI